MQTNRPSLNELVAVLKTIEPLCENESFQQLCYLLTLSKATDAPQLKDWTVYKGRYETFNVCTGASPPLTLADVVDAAGAGF